MAASVSVFEKGIGIKKGSWLLSGTVDPTADGGIEAPMGSLYLRNNGALYSELWNKIGSGNTEWWFMELRTQAVEKVNFTWDLLSPVNIKLLKEGRRILKVQIIIDTVFNDPSAYMSVGTSGLPELLMSANMIDLFSVAKYEADPDYLVVGEMMVQLFITPYATTQGAGTIILYYL